MKKRVLSLLMSFVMVISLLPATIRAAETPPVYSATVDFTAQAYGDFLLPPQFNVTVTSDLSDTYGYTDSVTDGVSALDVLVKAHELMFGAAFTKADKDTYLSVSGSSVSKIFGVETSANGFALNSGYPNKNGVGTTVTTQEVVDNDKLEFFIYQDTQAQDLMTWLEQYGTATDTIKAKPGAEVKLTVKGLCYGWAGYLYKDAEALRAAGSVVKNAQLAWVNATTGALTDITGAAANDNGSVTLTMPETEGTYYLTAYTTGEATPLILSLTKVVVDRNTPGIDPCALTNLEIKGYPSSGYEQIVLPLTPAFSAQTLRYSVAERPYGTGLAKVIVVNPTVPSGSTAQISLNGGTASNYSGNPVSFNTMLPGQDNVLTITVTNGEASKTYTVTVPMAADPAAPKLKDGVNATATASVVQGSPYTLDLSTIFEKGPSSVDLTYKVKVDTNDETTTGKDYSLATTDLSLGSHTLVFTAYSDSIAGPTHTVTLTVKASAAQKSARINTLLTNIAAANTNTDSDWLVMEMGAYAATHPDGAKLTESAKQSYINKTIQALCAERVSDTTYAKSILALTAIGADVQQLYPVNSNTPLNAITALNGVDHSDSPWNAPYTLAAYSQRDYANTETYERALINALLANQKEDGSWDKWGTIDTTANVIAGLSFYADETAVKTAIDKGVAYLATQMQANGTYGNANSTAMVIIGLAAAGVNPDTDSRFIKNGVSVLDDLLSFALADNSGFWIESNKTKPNDMATEQAFRALIAAKQVMTTDKAYNIYDFSANSLSPARATGSGAVSTPSAPTGDEIAVRVTIKADSGYWLNNKSVTIAGTDATVYHAFTEALDGTGITQVGAESGYVRSITKDGRTLAEFTNGKNSGWLYKVNGTLPTVGLTSQTINDGDSIVFYYTNDWTLDPDAGSMSEAKEPEASSSLAPSVTVSNGAASAEVSSSELSGALDAAEQNGESSITITPALRGEVDTVTVSLPLSAAAAAAERGVQLVIDTGTAQVVLDAEVLTELTGNGGTTLAVEVSAKSSADLTGTLTQDKLAGAAIAQVTVTAGGKRITSFGGRTLTVELPVDKDTFRAGARVRVYLFSDDGSVERTAGLCVEKGGKLVVRVETKHLSTFVVLPETVLPFTDVDDAAWYADAVRYAYDHALLTGVSDERFLPDGTATRAQLVTILHRLADSPAVDYLMQFSDVSEAAWYAEAVRWAASEGIVTGCDDGTFRPDDALTREQLAAILYRYVCAQGGGFTGMWYFPLRYEDAGTVSAWANEAMHWCVMRGLLTGTSATTLEPSASATRAQLATILQRFCTLDDGEEPSAVERAYRGAAAYLAKTVSAPTVDSIGGEWTVLALARGGEVSNPAAFDAYRTALERTLRETNGVLSERKYTEYSRVILALSALGEDARSFAGYDLTLPLADYDKTVAQGVNGAIFALLALDSADYPMPRGADTSAQATRERYVDCILSAQRADGGWSLKSDAVSADPDLTAMALQSLAAYRGQREVGDAVTAALDCLSALQNADGGFSASGAANAESCAQVLLALNALGIGTDDARFVKNGHSALDALLTFQTADGGFRHIAGGETNLMASEQSACALAALVRAERGECSFYRVNSIAASKAA